MCFSELFGKWETIQSARIPADPNDRGSVGGFVSIQKHTKTGKERVEFLTDNLGLRYGCSQAVIESTKHYCDTH